MNYVRRLAALAFFAAAFVPNQHVFAFTLWTEDGENGLANVIDQTDPSYPLLQSDVVGQGSNAFHLAHPAGQDNWFEINQTLSIQPGTKLFFLSQLRYATSAQIGRVQVSSDGGGSWPTDIFSQAGSDGPGEGAFSLKQINLDGYANQNLRFRFYYDVLPASSYYPQTDSDVGWFVDDIQVGSEYQKVLWSIGDPTPHEQLYLEYLNRSRADALAEANRLRFEPDSNIQSAYSFFAINPANIVSQFNWYVDNGAIDRFAQPLSFQSQLLTAAKLHTQDMFQHQFQAHNSSGIPPAPFQPGSTPAQRLDAVGYDRLSSAENIYAYSSSVGFGHAGFDVDWGAGNNPSAAFYNPAFDSQGMQNPAGHRRNIHNGDFKEVGIGVINGTNGSVGPQVVTEDFGDPGDISYVTGVVYQDVNNNHFYDLGEGRSGVRVDVTGSAFYAVSSTSGGYSVPVTQDGNYPVAFTGGGFNPFSAVANIVNGDNVKIDDLVTAIVMLAGDYNHNGAVDLADYAVWRKGLGTTYTQNDYNTWRANFGKSSGPGAASSGVPVPEPPAASLLLSVLTGLVYCRTAHSRETHRSASAHHAATTP